jgi:uridine kinase
VKALRIPVLNDHLRGLFAGEKVETAQFDLKLGKVKTETRPMQLQPGGIVVMEGIFSLNPDLTPSIPAEQKFKIFMAPLSQLNLDEGQFISNQITRLVRRIIRDYMHRGRGAAQTIGRWRSVRAGEERNIFPFVNQADTIYNSSSDYELSVLRPLVLPLLESVKPHQPEFGVVDELRRFLDWFHPMPASLVPSTSVLCEFIGESVFEEE